jgi:hypothetical protein
MIARVFPSKTRATPDDEHAYFMQGQIAGLCSKLRMVEEMLNDPNYAKPDCAALTNNEGATEPSFMDKAVEHFKDRKLTGH